jgi:transforming growth factor-beta-induced protein
MNAVVAQAQCEADATVYLTDFLFTPSEFTISVGQTVAFVNAEGTHNVDGTGESNPVSFFLEETEGNIDGVCMGTVTFDVPGVYTYTSSIGVQPELGMTGTIIVDAETLCDVMLSFWGCGENQNMDAYSSAYAFQSYFGCSFFGQSGGFPGSNTNLEGLDEYTLFLPNSAAIAGLKELMNLNSFDLLYFTEGMVAGLSYHMVPGVYLAEDLQDGAVLPTVEGQNLAVSVADDGGIMLNGATVLHEDIVAFNGVIHVIDEILVPPGYPGATTWDVIVQSPEHTIFEQALLAEGLNQALRGQPILNDNEDAEGPFTVFAPTDDAFVAIAEANGFESVDALLGSQFIDNILDAHIVPGVYESTDLFNGMNLASYDNSGTVNITIDDNGVQANTAPVIQADMLAYNGVVHSLGEVMPFDFPDPEGTCGAWTVTMTCGNDGPNGWEGSSLHVFANGNQIAAETMTTVGSESFSIPVDEGSRIDVVYNNAGWGQYHGYSVTDQNGTIVFSSSGTPISVYGLNPCEEEPSCGLIEITFTDNSYDGWYGGNMGVFSESGLEANIFFNPDFDGDGYADYQGFSTRTVMVTVDEGEVDFLVSSPVVYPTQCGYTVKNPEGDIVIDESSTNETPPSTLNYVICESAASSVAEAESTDPSISIFPNPVSTTAQLQGLSANEAWEVDILNLQGKVVRQLNGAGNGVFDATELPSGVYTILLRSSGTVRTLRMVKA